MAVRRKEGIFGLFMAMLASVGRSFETFKDEDGKPTRQKYWQKAPAPKEKPLSLDGAGYYERHETIYRVYPKDRTISGRQRRKMSRLMRQGA